MNWLLQSDMCPTMAEPELSAVQQFYRDSTVLITGGTGFLGKVLIEKLLRACPQLNQIVLLIRSKKEANCQERLDKLMTETVSISLR